MPRLHFGIACSIILLLLVGGACAYFAAASSIGSHNPNNEIRSVTTTPGASNVPVSEKQGEIEISRIRLDVFSQKQLQSLVKRLARLAPLRDQQTHALVHAVRLWGPTAILPQDLSPSGKDLLAALLNHKDFAKLFPGEKPLLVESPFGVTVRVGSSFAASPHTDKVLSVFAELGLPPSTQVQTRHKSADIADIVKDCISRFQLDQNDLEWTTVALCGYVPPETSWKNRFGQIYTFDILAEKLLSRRDGEGPCFGIHVMYSLCTILNAHARSPIISSAVHDRIVQRLNDVSLKLEQCQYSSGGWGTDWGNECDATRPQTRHPVGMTKDLMRSTGHHLEWIAIAPLNVVPAKSQIEAAAHFSLTSFEEMSDHTVEGAYNPLSHLVRALCLLHGTTPAELLPADFGEREQTESEPLKAEADRGDKPHTNEEASATPAGP